uniref:Aspartyl/Glutamyl-tRNA(Gln) amidotransferase subunit B/E catalytic domain-containing protein n=1 Tax=Macrostomum lignano TaxID=282301 RepID=A0A1I8FG47_9PLAT
MSGLKRLWQGVIGLEVHAQISSASKLFSASPTAFNMPVNTQVSLFDAAIPGTLPVLNQRCVELTLKTALALNCRINDVSAFDRKHYFYADMPAGYQITQHFRPLANHGRLEFYWQPDDNDPTSIAESVADIVQLQLEQDSGRSLHDSERQLSLIDLNRASGRGRLASRRQRLVPTGAPAAGDSGLGVRTEIKNINSLAALARAIDFEVARQAAVLDAGEEVINETRALADDATGRSVSIARQGASPGLTGSCRSRTCRRSFPSDLLPAASVDLPPPDQLPPGLRRRLRQELGFSYQHLASSVVAARPLADWRYLDAAVTAAKLSRPVTSPHLGRWFVHCFLGNCFRLLGESAAAEDSGISVESFGAFLSLAVDCAMISEEVGERLLERMFAQPSMDPLAEVQRLNWFLTRNPTEVASRFSQFFHRQDIASKNLDQLVKYGKFKLRGNSKKASVIEERFLALFYGGCRVYC